MHKALAIASVVFLLTLGAHAQFYVFGGYSYLNADLNSAGRTSLNGWNASVEGKVIPLLGFVADFSGNYGSANNTFTACPGGVIIGCTPTPANINVNLHQTNFLFGPQVSVSVHKYRPFAHALFGVSHLTESALGVSTSNNCFAYALGGGLDYHLIPMLALRVQGDLLQTRFASNTQNDARISTGIVLHF